MRTVSKGGVPNLKTFQVHHQFVQVIVAMSDVQSVLLFFTFVSSVFAFSGQYVPKSYYTIDREGHKSDVVYFRSKRDIESFPLLRIKRGGGSSASSQSSAKASSDSHSSGGGGVPLNPGSGYNPGIIDPGFDIPIFDPDFFHQHFGGGAGGGGGGGSGAFSHSFASSSSSSNSGFPAQKGFEGAGTHGGNDGPNLFSRFGEDTGTGVHVSGSAQGPRGAFSSSSSSIDSDGKIKYSVKSGKY